MSISLSLVAVFIPLLFMAGLPGRLFREFAVTLSVAVLISLVLSLTTTPMMCAWLLKPGGAAGRARRAARRALPSAATTGCSRVTRHSLDWALASKGLVMLILLAVVALNVYLFIAVPKSLFPQQDTGQLDGRPFAPTRASRRRRWATSCARSSTSCDAIPRSHRSSGSSAASRAGGGFMFVELKPRRPSAPSTGLAVIARLRPQLAHITGLRIFLQPVQDVRAGGRSSNSTYQYTLKGENSADLREWSRKLMDELKTHPEMTDIDSDQQENGVETNVKVDPHRGRAPRHPRERRRRVAVRRVRPAAGGDDLHGAQPVPRRHGMGAGIHAEPQRAVRRLRAGNVARQQRRRKSSRPSARCRRTHAAVVAASGGRDDRRAAGFAEPGAAQRVERQRAQQHAGEPRAAVDDRVVHRAADGDVGQSPGHRARDDALVQPRRRRRRSTTRARRSRRPKPTSACRRAVRGSFAGTALLAQQSSSQQWILIVAALIVIYIVLGVLYESLVHPLTVLSTLPSAGVGAVLALLLFRMDFTLIALIGVFLLIGIVKKNAILIIDFALEAERSRGLSPFDAVREACLLRFRPILMTTLAAALGALPLAIGFGEGSELRRPLGVAIIGGPDRKPDADAAHDAGRLSAARQAAPARRRRAAPEPCRAARGGVDMTMPPFGDGPRARWCSRRRSRSCRPARSGRNTSAPIRPSPRRSRKRRQPAIRRGSRQHLPMRWTAARGGSSSATRCCRRWRAEVEVSNQNVAAAVASYAQAQALVSQQRAALFPLVGLDASATRNGGKGAVASGSNLRLGFTASWEPDIWGALRLAVTGAQASAAAERRESRRGAAVGAGRARHRLLRAARGRQRDRAC